MVPGSLLASFRIDPISSVLPWLDLNEQLCGIFLITWSAARYPSYPSVIISLSPVLWKTDTFQIGSPIISLSILFLHETELMSSSSRFRSAPFPRSNSIFTLPLVMVILSTPTKGLDIVRQPFRSLIATASSLTEELTLTSVIMFELIT